MQIYIDHDSWRPESRDVGYCSPSRLKPGMLVAMNCLAYEVVEVNARPHTDWSENYRKAWVDQQMPDPETWYYRPYMVVLRQHKAQDSKDNHEHFEVANSYSFWTLGKHYSVCNCCGDVPPCREVHQDRVTARSMKRLAWQMALLPGCCHACGEPITRRQKSVLFEGENLIRPDMGEDTARFHTRMDCLSGAKQYDKKWAKKTGRPRKLRCEGRLREHADGSTECSNDPECIGHDKEHQSMERHDRGMSGKWSGCWCVAGGLV